MSVYKKHPWAPRSRRLSDELVALLLLAGEGEGYKTQETWNPGESKVGDYFLVRSRLKELENDLKELENGYVKRIYDEPGGIIIYRLRNKAEPQGFLWEIVYKSKGEPSAKSTG